ncbi:MAG: type II toxin-antitoxin system Phd/YefM family antitoxin [Candidatus Dormibacteria bacterium]
MSRTIPQRELRNHNATVIEAVVAGETFVVTRNGTPVAEIGPVTAGRRQLVPRGDVAAVAARAAHIDAVAWRRDRDALVDDDVVPAR